MKIKNKLALSLPLLAVVALSLGYWGWGNIELNKRFECRARVYSQLIANGSNKSSMVDLFLSLHGDGKGYFLVAGTHTLPQMPLVELDSVVNFTYRKEGGYYSLHLGKRSRAAIVLFDLLKYDDIKVKFTHVDNNDYIVSSPIETVMICKTD